MSKERKSHGIERLFPVIKTCVECKEAICEWLEKQARNFGLKGGMGNE